MMLEIVSLLPSNEYKNLPSIYKYFFELDISLYTVSILHPCLNLLVKYLSNLAVIMTLISEGGGDT